MIELQLWQLITLLLSFFGCIAAFGKVLLNQFDKRLAERFKAQEKAQQKDQDHWDERFSTLGKKADEWVRVERNFLDWKAALPMTYVMRDDYVRNQTVIEAKLDAIAVRQENILLKGAKNEH